ncbi:MAG: hypothetical protein RBU45_00400 [Myxococcota bacterium]|nr:hypothetical protein [Myxococcota bacterium]
MSEQLAAAPGIGRGWTGLVLVVSCLLCSRPGGAESLPVRVQVAVVADSAALDADEESSPEAQAISRTQGKLALVAPSLRGALEEELADYVRALYGSPPRRLFQVVAEPILEQRLRDAVETSGRVERDRLLQARLGLSAADEPGPTALFPGWICEQLQETGAQLGVVAYLREQGAVLKVVLARPCHVVGRRTDETTRDHLTMLLASLQEILDVSYRSELQVVGSPGLVVVVDGETAGKLPLAAPVDTVPGVRELRAQGEILCDRVVRELLPGESLWSANPCAPPARGPGLLVWGTAGAALLLAGAAGISHWDAARLADEAVAEQSSRQRALDLRADARAAAWRTNGLYGAAAAAGVGALLLYLLTPDTPLAITLTPSRQGVVLGYARPF